MNVTIAGTISVNTVIPRITFDAGVRSLECHRTYLENLGGDMASPATFLRDNATASGERLGVELAATFEVID